jgi:hypothetical protein
MNVLIIDTEKITLDLAHQICKDVMDHSELDDLIAIPKGIDVMQDISVDWMKMIRDKMDEKIREIENNTK